MRRIWTTPGRDVMQTLHDEANRKLCGTRVARLHANDGKNSLNDGEGDARHEEFRQEALDSSRLTSLALILSEVEIAPEVTQFERVQIGQEVTWQDAETEHQSSCVIGGPDEPDAYVDESGNLLRTVSYLAPLGKALMGRGVGDAVTVQLPGGQREVEILAIKTPTPAKTEDLSRSSVAA